MKRLKYKARLPLCGFILLSFFLPAYAHYTAMQFISLVLSSVNKAYEITTTDAVVAIGSLLLIPLSALVLVFRGALRLSTRRVYVAMPLIFFLFFAGILFTNLSAMSPSFNAFAATGPGFYVACIAALLLLFTKSPRRKTRRRKKVAETELAV